jgi:hypothetical protein
MKKFLFSMIAVFMFTVAYSQTTCEPHVNVTTSNTSSSSCVYPEGGIDSQMWGIQIAVSKTLPSYRNTFVVRGTMTVNGNSTIAYFVFVNQIFSSRSGAEVYANRFSKGCYVLKRLDGANGIFPIISVKQ